MPEKPDIIDLEPEDYEVSDTLMIEGETEETLSIGEGIIFSIKVIFFCIFALLVVMWRFPHLS
jgi:hypothetical protein